MWWQASWLHSFSVCKSTKTRSSLSLVPLKLVWMLDSPKQPLPLSHSLSLVPLKLVWMLDSPKQPLPLSLSISLSLSLTYLLKLFSFLLLQVVQSIFFSFLLALFVCLDLTFFTKDFLGFQMKKIEKNTHIYTDTNCFIQFGTPHLCSSKASKQKERRPTHLPTLPTHPPKSCPLTTLILWTALSLCGTQQ